MTNNNNHVVWHNGYVTRRDRNRLNRHKSGVLWFTGLPGSGKSTIAHRVEQELYKLKARVYVMDGDNIRHGLNADLGFDLTQRQENIRRIVEVSKLFIDAGMILISAFISPMAENRDYARKQLKEDNFYEIFVECSLKECIRRDIKGHYRQALRGIIKNYTGISAPYEEPQDPDLVINTEKTDIETSVAMLLDFLDRVGLVKMGAPRSDSERQSGLPSPQT
jgi:adenylylsulfate kinase